MSLRAKPMHIFCRFLGVAPYCFDPGSWKRKFKVSKIGTIYSVFISAFLGWFAILNYQTTKANLSSGSYVTIGAQWLQFYVNNGFSVVIVVANLFQQSKIVEVFNAIYDPRNQPTQIPDHIGPTKDVVYGTMIVVITISLHLATTLTSYFDNEKRIDYYWFPYGILLLLNALVVLQFLCAVVKLGDKFHHLCVRLEDCVEECHRIPSISYNHNSDKIIADLAKVDKIAEEHLKLTEQTDLLNSAFSHQLLLCFVSALIISVSGLYLICKRIIQRTLAFSNSFDDEKRETAYNWWALSCYPLLHSLILGSIIIVCHRTVNKSNGVNEILPRVQRVFQNSEYSIIDRFQHQLTLHKISFNVFHLFTIDPSMICSIISTVLTYLIISVQFEIGQKQENTRMPDTFNSVSLPLNESYGDEN